VKLRETHRHTFLLALSMPAEEIGHQRALDFSRRHHPAAVDNQRTTTTMTTKKTANTHKTRA